MRKKTEKTNKNTLHELSQMSKTVGISRTEKEYNDVDLLFHKYKDRNLNSFIMILFTGAIIKWVWKP